MAFGLEVDVFPPAMLAAAAYVDEVWVASEHVAEHYDRWLSPGHHLPSLDRASRAHHTRARRPRLISGPDRVSLLVRLRQHA